MRWSCYRSPLEALARLSRVISAPEAIGATEGRSVGDLSFYHGIAISARVAD
jgi:hypothetical protein